MKQLLIAVAVVLVLAGCATQEAETQGPQKPKVCIFFETNDVLIVSAGGESMLKPFTKRIEEHLVTHLRKHGIQTVSSDMFMTGDAKLTVKLKTIETRSEIGIPLWGAPAVQQHYITYSSTLLFADGTTLLNGNRVEDDASLDLVAGFVAKETADLVRPRYREKYGK